MIFVPDSRVLEFETRGYWHIGIKKTASQVGGLWSIYDGMTATEIEELRQEAMTVLKTNFRHPTRRRMHSQA